MDALPHRTWFPLAVLGLLALCSTAAPQEPLGVSCDDVADGVFPALELSDLEKGWYGKHLEAAGEPDLCDRAEDLREVYRFTWLRTFHPPVIVRIERHDSSHRLVAKKLDGSGGYEPGELVVDRSTAIGARKWGKFKSLLSAASFWSASRDEATDVVGVDGARWIFEGVRNRTYWAKDLWSPDVNPSTRPYRRLGIYLLDLAGLLPSDEEAIY